MTHLHRHYKNFINKYKHSVSTRPSRRGVPRGGTRPIRRGISRRPHGASSSLQGRRASFTTKELSPIKGETWLSHVQAALHHQKSAVCKGSSLHHVLLPQLRPPCRSHATSLWGMFVFSFYSSGQVFFLLSTPVATPPSSLS